MSGEGGGRLRRWFAAWGIRARMREARGGREAWRRAPLQAALGLRAQEKTGDGLGRLGACVGIARAQFGQGAVQHLLREAARERLQHGVHVLAPGDELLGACDLQRAPFVGLCVDLLNERHHAAHGAALVHPVHEALHARVDDGFGLRHGCLAAGLRGLHDAGEVVHGVEVDVLERLHLGLDVARHGQIDHEHGAVAAFFERALDGAQADDGQAAGRAADHGIELVQAVGQVGQPHDLAAEAGGKLFTALQRAVGDGEALGVLRREVGGGEFDHLARAHEKDADLRQVFEQLPGQAHGGGGHADAVGADLGAGTHFLGDGEAALEELVERGAERAGRLCRAHGVLHLAEDLGLAQHHGIEPAGHAERMARHEAFLERVGVRAQQRRAHAAAVGEPVERMVQRRLLAGAVDLGAVAGGEDGGFHLRMARGAAQRLAQALQRGRDLVDGERKTAAQIERRGRVVDAEGPDCHKR